MLAGVTGIDLLFVLIAILISMTIHEAMHGYAAYWLGDTTAADLGRLTFNPLKSIDLMTTVLLPLILIVAGSQPFFAAKPVPFNPNRVKYGEYGAALVGITGPLTNLLLAIIGGIVFREYASTASNTIYQAVLIFVEVNVGFFIFNIIPFPPLDGSRVLYAFAPEPLQEVMRRIESFGFIAIIIFFFVVFRLIAGPIDNIEAHILHLVLGLNFVD
jgi:Zn-dependent protease